MNNRSPLRQSISRFFVKDIATIIRQRLCIQPVCADFRTAASDGSSDAWKHSRPANPLPD